MSHEKSARISDELQCQISGYPGTVITLQPWIFELPPPLRDTRLRRNYGASRASSFGFSRLGELVALTLEISQGHELMREEISPVAARALFF